jgi:hypothetical protein
MLAFKEVILYIFHFLMISTPFFLNAQSTTSIPYPMTNQHIPTILYIYQPQDFSPLYDDESPENRGIKADELKRQWDQLLFELKNKGNLKIIEISEIQKEIKKNNQFQQILSQAQFLARQGIQRYQEVELDQAMVFFEKSLQAYQSIDYFLFEPQEIAQVYLELAFCALELSDEIKAEESFRMALIHQPKLRLKKGIDGDQAIALFAKSKQRLIHLLENEELRSQLYLDAQSELFRPSPQAFLLKTIMHPRFFHAQLLNGANLKIIIEPINISSEFIDTGSRIASKIWYCLPFSQGVKKTVNFAFLEIYSGIHYFSYLFSPTTLFSNVGADIRLVLASQQRVAVELDLSWANSNRDSQEHLREDLTTWRMALMPKIALWKNTRITINLSLGLELNHLSAIKLTREVGCKYFVPSPDVPKDICLFNEDFQNFDASWKLGAKAQLEINMPLSSDAFRLSVLINATNYFVEYNPAVLGLPIGGSLQLGYSFL